MADPVSYGKADRDIEQALIALKKGAQLLKYGRKGKPKFCSFRLSHDESSLIWVSSSGERSLKLSLVSRIIPGQRTAVFRRYLHPEKDYLSFSLIYNNEKRSLDLICKDKAEAEVWISGLKTLVSSRQGGRSKIDGWSNGGLYIDVKSLKHQCEIQESELQKSTKKAHEAMVLAAEESAKCKAAKDVIISLTAQLKEMSERLAPGANGVLHYADTNGDNHLRSNQINGSHLMSPTSTSINGTLDASEEVVAGFTDTNERTHYNSHSPESMASNGRGGAIESNGFKHRNPAATGSTTTTTATTTAATGVAMDQVEAEWIEQYEPGVYITLLALHDGTRDLKRVRFSRRRFGEHQAETWWSENREKVYEKYNVRGSDKSSASSQAARRSGESLPPPDHY